MERCTHCLLPETYPQISFNAEGICNFCSNTKVYTPKPEKKLTDVIERAKSKNRIYDALVPLSGGKDSTYVLYLAKKKYGLNVLTYTFDNGFLSEIALKNINSAIKALNVDNVFIRPNWNVLKKLYKNILLKSGELCTVCGIGILHNKHKIAEAWRIPLVLDGASYMESNSYTPEPIYDINRFNTILKEADDITSNEIKTFLIYEHMTPVKAALYSMTGKFGIEVSPLLYMPKMKEDDISEILSEELGWQEGIPGKQQKHFDCLAEPFTNYTREYRYGFSRRVCQYSNLIRIGEMTRDEALEKLSEENPDKRPAITNTILERLDISEEELDQIIKIAPFKYSKYEGTYLSSSKVLRPLKKMAKMVLSRFIPT